MATAWVRLSDSASLPMGRRHTALHAATSLSVSPVTSRPKTKATLLGVLSAWTVFVGLFSRPASPRALTRPDMEVKYS